RSNVADKHRLGEVINGQMNSVAISIGQSCGNALTAGKRQAREHEAGKGPIDRHRNSFCDVNRILSRLAGDAITSESPRSTGSITFKPMKIYTRTGDAGDTGLFGGGRVPKDDARVEAYGDVDELNAVIGMARAVEPLPRIDEVLVPMQRDLFSIGALLATPDLEKMHGHLSKANIDEQESEISSTRSMTAKRSWSRSRRSSSPVGAAKEQSSMSLGPSAAEPSGGSFTCSAKLRSPRSW